MIETKSGDAFYERIQEQVWMSSAYYVNLMGVPGGMVLRWRDDVRVIVRTSTQNIIDC